MQQPLTVSQLCSVTSSSTTSQLFSDHLSFSQVAKLFQTLPKLLHLFPPLSSSLLFSTLLNGCHLCPPRLDSSQLLSTLLTSCQLFKSAHLFSPPLNSPDLFLSSSQLISPSQLRASFTQRSSYTQTLFHTSSFNTQHCFCT